MKLLKRFKDKLQAFRVANHAAYARELATMRNNGESNTRLTAKERETRKNRKKIARKSRQRNRK